MANASTQENSKVNLRLQMYEMLKQTVIKLDPKDRFCVMLINESGIERKYVPNNELAEEEIPTHMINFMLRGIYGPWKLPISNIFWKRQGGEPFMGEIIKTIIRNVHTSGLTVIATVSDHSKFNIEVVNYLTKDSTIAGSFMVDFNRVFHVFDPCRLLKSVRNHLVKNDLVFEMKGQKKVASWGAIRKIFTMDGMRSSWHRKLPKLTLEHVHPNYLDKLTTRVCAHVFSETVSREISRSVAANEMHASCQDTADLILFFDQLFDTCNGKLPFAIQQKSYRCAIGSGNPHFTFWPEAEKVLDSMRYILPDTDKVYRPDCLDKWVVSLNSMMNVWKALKKLKIKFIPTRNFNLDALTNMLQILRVFNDEPGNVYCEETDGEILDQNILKIVLEEDAGYFEVRSLI